MTMTWSVLASSSDRAEATTRLFTLVRRSTSLDRPPKKKNSGPSFTTAWSPPRLRAMSQGQRGKECSSRGVCPWQPKPMERVAATPLGLCTWRISSRMGNFFR